MKQGTAIIAFKRFEISNPAKVLGGQTPPIIDKKKLRTPNRSR